MRIHGDAGNILEVKHPCADMDPVKSLVEFECVTSQITVKKNEKIVAAEVQTCG